MCCATPHSSHTPMCSSCHSSRSLAIIWQFLAVFMVISDSSVTFFTLVIVVLIITGSEGGRLPSGILNRSQYYHWHWYTGKFAASILFIFTTVVIVVSALREVGLLKSLPSHLLQLSLSLALKGAGFQQSISQPSLMLPSLSWHLAKKSHCHHYLHLYSQHVRIMKWLADPGGTFLL